MVEGNPYMLEQKIDALIVALDKNTAALTGGKPAAAATATAAAGKPGRPAAPKITQDDVAAKASALKEAQGMPAVRAMFKEHGSDDGKIAGVPKANYAALVAAIDTALSGGDGAAEEEDEGL